MLKKSVEDFYYDKYYTKVGVRVSTLARPYVENLKDPIDKSKNCNDNSYVIIKRNSNNINSDNFDIEYTACLKCSNYTSSSCLEDITGIKIIN